MEDNPAPEPTRDEPTPEQPIHGQPSLEKSSLEKSRLEKSADPDASDPEGWQPPPTDPHVLEQFWDLARTHARFNYAPGYFGPSVLDVVIPPTLTLGDTPETALESLSALVADEGAVLRSPLAGAEEELPQPGALGIVVDDEGHPRALVATSRVEVEGEDLVEELTVLYAE